jgi:PadR family transcriptional regulator, regulatory protein AphA
MSIEFAILGLLSWSPLSGYDLKKMFVDSVALYWSGNNNEIYKALVELHKNGLVTRETQYQENRPPRKVYSITEKGLEELRKWVLTDPKVAHIKHTFLIQLAWADRLSLTELDELLTKYEGEVQMQLLISEDQIHPVQDTLEGLSRESCRYLTNARTTREAFLWKSIMENWANYYRTELEWVRNLRKGLNKFG